MRSSNQAASDNEAWVSVRGDGDETVGRRSGWRRPGRHPGGAAATGALALLVAVAMLNPGCRRRRQTEYGAPVPVGVVAGGADVEPGPPPADWPRVLVIGPGTGPALYLGHQPNSAAVGYLNPGARVRLESSVVNGRIEALVAGGLATKGWIPVDRLAAYATARGRVEGTRAYLGPGDLVGVLGAEGDNLRVEARPWLGGANFIGPFVGTFPRGSIADAPPEGDVEGVSPGECFALPAGSSVTVFERPGGDAVANLPALDPPATVVVLRQADGWFGVRAGYGPYLTGYVQGALIPCVGERPAPAPMVPASDGDRPYWMSQENGPLHRVAAGTSIRFHGRTIGRLRAEGWARELGRQDGDMVDVFVAVDDRAAVRGLVPAASLTLVEGGAAPAAQPTPSTPAAAQPAPAEPLPPELQ